MFHLHLIITLLVLCTATASSQRSYFAEFGEGTTATFGEGPTIVPTPDGGAVIGVTTDVSATDYMPAFSSKTPGIIRIDSTGKIVEGHSYEGYMTGALLPAPDSTFILLAAKTLIKLAADGSVVWCRAIEVAPSVSLVYNSAIATRDGGALLLGWMQRQFSSTSSLFLTKVNRNGEPQWRVQTGGTGVNGPCSAVQMRDGRFIIGAYTTRQADDHYNDRAAALLELSESGEILSTRIIERLFSSVSIKLLRNDQEEILAMVAGHGNSSESLGIEYTGILTLLDSTLQPKWSREIADAKPIDIGFEGGNPLVLVYWWTPKVRNWKEEDEEEADLSVSEQIKRSQQERRLRTRYFLAALKHDGNIDRLCGLPADSGRNEYHWVAGLSSGGVLCLGTHSEEEEYSMIGLQGKIQKSDCWALPTSGAPPLREIPSPTLTATEWEQQEGEEFEEVEDKTTLSPLHSSTRYLCRDDD